MASPLKKWLFLTQANQQILDKNLLYGMNQAVTGVGVCVVCVLCIVCVCVYDVCMSTCTYQFV